MKIANKLVHELLFFFLFTYLNLEFIKRIYKKQM